MLRSITSKLTLLFVCLAVLAVSIAGSVFTAVFGNHIRSEEKNSMESCANEIAQLISNERMLSTFVRELPIPEYIAEATGYHVWVCNTSGVFFRTGNDNLAPSNLSDLDGKYQNFIDDILRGYTLIGNDFEDMFGSGALSVGVPITVTENASREIIGAVILHKDSESYNNLMTTAFIMIPFTIAAAGLIALLIGRLFSVQFSKPLKKISDAASEMSHGNYDVKIGYLNQPELNTIAESLGSLALTTKNSVADISKETAQLSNIIENISDGIAAYDTNMNLIRYNAALLNICEKDYFSRDDVRNAMLEVMENGGTKTITIEDSNKILSFTITQIRSIDRVDGVIAVVSDITERERLEQTRREFVSNVSHEFRTPLTIIRGAVELLLDDVLDSEEAKKECYKKIDSESAALTNLVKDLLDTSRMKSGKIKIEPKKVDLNQLIETTVDHMQIIAANKKIKINYEPKKIPAIWADEARIRQLIIIFIDNAIKFTPEKGTITVSIYAKSGKAYLCVKDTGCGISKEDQPYVFERFYKVDKARGGSETGTGLGLAIAWQIAKLHKGTIIVESEVNQGTTFKTVLPLAQEDSPDEEES